MTGGDRRLPELEAESCEERRRLGQLAASFAVAHEESRLTGSAVCAAQGKVATPSAR